MSRTSEPMRPLPPSSAILISFLLLSPDVSRLSGQLARVLPLRGGPGCCARTAPPGSRECQHQGEAGKEHADLEEQRAPGGSSEVNTGRPAADRRERMPGRSSERA